MMTNITIERALRTYGYDRQRTKLFEEMAELQNALCKHVEGRASDEEVITEIADVQIMLDQMKLHFGESKVAHEEYYKLMRLKKRMDLMQ